MHSLLLWGLSSVQRHAVLPNSAELNYQPLVLPLWGGARPILRFQTATTFDCN